MADKVLVEQEERINQADGTVQTTRRRTVIKQEPEPDYVKVYLNMVLSLRGLPTTTSPLLGELIKRMSYAHHGQRVIINKTVREEIQQTLGISRITYYAQLKQLIKRGIVATQTPGDYGTLYVNPYIVGRGSWDEIKEIRAYVHLDRAGGVLCAETSGKKSQNDEIIPTLDHEGFKWSWDMNAISEIANRPPEKLKNERER